MQFSEPGQRQENPAPAPITTARCPRLENADLRGTAPHSQNPTPAYPTPRIAKLWRTNAGRNISSTRAPAIANRRQAIDVY